LVAPVRAHISPLPRVFGLPGDRNAAFTRQHRSAALGCRLKAAFRGQCQAAPPVRSLTRILLTLARGWNIHHRQMIACAESPFFVHAPIFGYSRRALRHALGCCLVAALLSAKVFADSPQNGEPGGSEATNALGDAVILVIRHAEKPDKGTVLSPEGRQRAEAYVHYFEHYHVDGQPLGLDYLVATADSAGSERPRLTLEPLSKALGIKIDQQFKSKECRELAEDLRAHPHGKHILVCWHHGKIAELVTALGADASQLLPGGKWPDDQFGWVLELRYDHGGHLIPGESKRLDEGLILRQTSRAN
jgi:hypothetical protein